MPISGIDVSRYQKAKRLDYNALKRAGYDFAIIRAGFGMYNSQKDVEFENHYSAAGKAGIYRGAYHYSYALSEADAKREADCFLRWIKGKKLEYPVAFDIEDASQKKLTSAQRTDIALTFMEKVEAEGYYTMIYANADWFKNYLEKERLKQFDVWLACYTSEKRRDELYQGILGIWQKQSTLKLPGVYGGNLDENVAYKDYARIIKNAGLNGF